MSPETLAVLGVGVALAGLMLTLFRDLKSDLRDLRGDLHELRRDLHELAQRVARIEGTLSGPWRPDGAPEGAETP